MTRRPNPILVGLGVVGWAGLVWLAVTMYTATPRTAGFDLDLVLQAGRNVASGTSPYDPAMVGGSAPGATDLFYSYPPPVAQFFRLFAGLPFGVMFVGLWVASVAGLAAVTGLIAKHYSPDRSPAFLVVPVVAVAPLFLPYSVALLFGNVDALFPFAYGLVLLAAVAHLGSFGQRDRVDGGVALALATITKVAPGILGGWFVARWLRGLVDRRARRAGRAAGWVIVWAAATTVVVVGLSLLFGGQPLWQEYASVAGAASQAELVDARNAGPAAQIALAIGGDEALVRSLQIPVAVAAVIAALAAGLFVRDRLLGVTIAAVASLVILPITWYHYPVMLMPFGIATVARAERYSSDRRTVPLVVAAVALASLSIAWLPGLWIAVGVLVAGVVSGAAAATAPQP